MSYFQRIRLDCRNKSFYTAGTQKRIDCFYADGFCGQCNTAFEATGFFYIYCPCQDGRSALSEEDTQRGTIKREMDEMRKRQIDEIGYTLSKCGNVNGGHSRRLMCQ